MLSSHLWSLNLCQVHSAFLVFISHNIVPNLACSIQLEGVDTGDFEAVNAAAFLLSTESSKTIFIAVKDDNLPEADETFTFNLRLQVIGQSECVCKLVCRCPLWCIVNKRCECCSSIFNPHKLRKKLIFSFEFIFWSLVIVILNVIVSYHLYQYIIKYTYILGINSHIFTFAIFIFVVLYVKCWLID